MRSRTRLFVSCLLLVLAAASLPAQNSTVPAALDGVEGGGGTNIPFGSSQSCRYQCIYDAEELPWSGPRILTGIMVRADFGTGAAIPQKGYLDLSVKVSTTNVSASDASPVFAANYGSDVTTVIDHQPFLLPAQPDLTGSGLSGPRPANIPFLFQVPWAYGLSPVIQGQPAPRNLLVEVHIHAQPSGSYRIDGLSTCIATTSTFGTVAAPCEFVAGQPVALTGDTSMTAGSAFQWHVDHAPPSMPFLVALNFTDQGGLFGNPAWPLPYPMFDPQNPTLQSQALQSLIWPAPGCYLNLTPLATLGGVCTTTGTGDAGAQLPGGREVVGSTWYAQAIVLAPTVNPLRIITSGGYASTVCGPLGIARIHAFYNPNATPPDPVPTAGQKIPGVAMVFDVL